ncbi:ABC transporter ATP-binding protein [Tsukamurella sp. 8F]|uniref:ABC transporter ATP-binding protein n=1 Tax=unclassified Tsukamurella TaxID=2633480 RepID=UPI0023B8973E|nr:MULTISPECIES: ABC transporter ATP-binding protein [unclassified Tsukamurella]MDF0531179.1 ABC transporter ATP-binding protein [Tsukamurella sp. 8J]MDF0585874.1 ABC transporter ATP-binding protein [Tsukamurella sp. 8F]
MNHLGRLREIVSPARILVATSVALQVLSGLAQVGGYIAVIAAVRHLVETGSPDWRMVGIAAGAFLLVPVLHGGSFTASFAASRRVEYALRTRLAAHLSRIRLGWFTDSVSIARLRKGIGPDIGGMSDAVGEAIPLLARSVAVTVAALVYLFTVSPVLAAVVAVPVVMASYLEVHRLGGRTDADARFDAAARVLTARTAELSQGISVAKIFGSGRRTESRFLNAADDYAQAYIDREADQQRRSLMSAVLASWTSVLGIVVVAGTLSVAADLADPVDVVAFLLLSWIVSRSVWTVPTFFMTMRRVSLVLTGIDTLFAEPVLAVPDRPEGAVVAPVTVCFDDVTFGYGSDPVLHGVTLRLRPGTTTAVLGASGSGKSTLARLIPRFWDPDGGAISLNGTDIRDLAPSDLYRAVAFVFQDVQLLRKSLADNIRLARPEASLAEVEAAARAARIHDRIVDLPRGYDSVYGEDAHLSGGEAQRVSIARAILADAPVLVLDEATSAADPESEILVQEALARLSQGRTVLTIAHKLATVAAADSIVVLDRGRVAETGTHDELRAAGGRYASMWAADRAGVV